MRTIERSPRISPAAETPAKPRQLPKASGSKKADTLSPAIVRFEEATEARAASDSARARANFVAAKSALQLATLDLINESTSESAPRPAALQRVPIYLEQGQDLIAVGDRRARARADYMGHAKSIGDAIEGSLAHAWTLFGRVIARQSLIELHAALDEIKQRSDSLLQGAPWDPQSVDGVIAAESRFGAVLKKNASSLKKSEGPDWLRAVQDHLDGLVRARESLARLSDRYDESAQRFSQDGPLLSARLADAYRAQAVSEERRRAVTEVVRSAAQPGATIEAKPVVSVTETTVERGDPEAPRLMAIVTAAVLSLIVLISVLLVRSIVRPVRDLVKAANRVARGDCDVFVARGGIEELDSVSRAFNEMSRQLQAMHKERKEQQESLEAKVLERTHQLQQLAHQDPLTSLPNRRHLPILLNLAIERAARDKRLVGVYFLDIDNFKNINDSVGHAFGDRVLMSVANRLEELTDGFGFVARLGGDEFTIVFENAESIAAIHELGGRIARAFHQLLSVDDRELSLSVSVGASIFPAHEVEADALLRAADSALFRAKELGRSQLAVFTPELITTAARRFTIEQGLRQAIEKSEFEVAYQPEISLPAGQTELVEALLRWRLPDGRVVRPGDFLAVAEQSGAIAEIDAWVLRAAVADAARWYHGPWRRARVAINISARQLLDRHFVESALALLREFNLPTRCIEFELTETALQTGPTTISSLRALRSHGFGVALDDFGTGYSSLTSLEQLPLSRIKLDRSLVATIDTSERSAAIAQAILDLCAGLSLEVTAEGIERAAQFNWFVAKRGLLLQGYLLSDSVPFEDVVDVKDLLARKVRELSYSAQPAYAQ